MTEDRVPDGPRESQPTVLVSGQARALLRRIPLQLLAERVAPGDGAVIVTAREDPAVVARRLCGAVSAFDPSLVTMVDATSKATGGLTRVDDRRWHVPSPVSFGHVRVAVDAALDELGTRDAASVHFLVDTPTTQFRLADADLVHQYTHDLAMVVGAEHGLGLLTLEPAATTEREFEQVRHLVDVHVAVRRTANGPQVRWTGLVGSSDGWTGLKDAGIHFDALGRNLG